MVAALDDTTLFQDHDAVTVFDSGQSVGDDKGGSALHQFIHAVLYDFLSTGINGAGSLIQDQSATAALAMDRSCLCPWLKFAPSPVRTVL